MGSFPTPKGGLPGCRGDLWMLAGRSPMSTLEGSVLSTRGSPGHGAWTGKQGAPHLVAQHEPVAVGLGDLVPAHQHAAGGGGQRRHVGGAGGRHWGRREGKEGLRTQRGPRSGQVEGVQGRNGGAVPKQQTMMMFTATVMLLAPERHTCCFWHEVSPCDPRSDSRQDEPALPASAAVGVQAGGARWEGSHHLKGVRKKPQGTRHVRTHEGCLQAGSTYSVGFPLPGPCERL